MTSGPRRACVWCWCSGDAALAYERHPDDAPRFSHGGWLRPAIASKVPAWRFVAAGRALQGHPPPLEMQERVMPVEPADELPELLGGACHDAGGGWCCGHRLLRVGNHCRDSPFLSNHWYDAGLRDAVARDSFSVIARHFKSSATARPYRKRPVTE